MKAPSRVLFDTPDGMKVITVRTEWVAEEDIEVPEDWEWDGELGSLLEFSELSCHTASLHDWELI